MGQIRELLKKPIRAMPYRAQVRWRYWRQTGRVILPKHPDTFAERLTKTKLTHARQRSADLMDKIEAKRIVADLLGAEWVTPTLWSGAALPPRDQRNWPLPFVLKAAHGYNMNIFGRSPADLDWPVIERKAADWLGINFGLRNLDLNYTLIQPRLLVEPYLGSPDAPPPDFKLFTFGGRVEYIQVDTDRDRDHKRTFFDREWRRQAFRLMLPIDNRPIPRPASLDAMIAAAEQIAKAERLTFVRADFYDLSGAPRFGELTLIPGAGIERFEPPEIERLFATLWPANDHVGAPTAVR